MIPQLKKKIEEAWDDRNLLTFPDYADAIEMVIDLLDKGEIRVAEPVAGI